ncbi:ABC transporter [Bifidobacterium hapali]|uniref:ABC transporter n=1 Tax=Bifidobacterium hapali TaxID=1630172 RepID=A0A261FZF9_9BIFI|nr:ABC transporter ATP-binding protein [Bifidobacterium hapali]OZG64569.1 ABC transporter [Bifidobacterium hapali]
MRLIFHYVRRHWVMALTAAGFLLIETIGDLLQPTLMSMIVDQGVVHADVGVVLRWGALMLAVALIGAGAAAMRNIYASRASQLIGRDIRSDTYRKVMALGFDTVDRLQPGAIITRITNDVVQIQNFAQGLMRIMLKAPITCVGAIALIIIQIPEQTPTVAVILIIAALLIWANMHLSFPRFLRVQRALDRLGIVSREFLRSIRVVKAFVMEHAERARFGAAARGFADANVSATRVNATFGPLINLSVNMGIVAMLWLSRSQHAAQIGALMASMNYMTQVLFALNRVSMIVNSATRASASAARIKEIFDCPNEFASATSSHESDSKDRNDVMLPTSSSAVTLHNVTFTYEQSAVPALRDITFTMARGATLGIIGPTGSGKSTLVSLIARLYDPQSGTVMINGRNAREWDVDELRAQIALVSQQPVLFTGTIRSNLQWGDPQADAERIRRAAHLACADEFIETLPGGYDARVGQGGVNLSGGQKQRINLARALVRNPHILILDDCTSALDAVTEHEVLANLRSLTAASPNATSTSTAAAAPAQPNHLSVIIISQRITTVRTADRIIVMDNGHIAGIGTHNELMRTCELCQAISASQLGGDRHE